MQAQQIRDLEGQVNRLISQHNIQRGELEVMVAAERATRAELEATRNLQQNSSNAHFQRALNSVPIYSGTGRPFREHVTNFSSWRKARGITDVEQSKLALAYSLRDSAQTRVRAFLPDSAGWEAATTFEGYLASITEIFCPTQEQGLSRSEFLAYNQGPQEDVGTFISIKYSLFELAYSPNERSFQTLRSAVLKGLYNPVIKRTVARQSVTDEESLRKAIFQAVAAERECFLGGYAESPNLDGLKSVTLNNYRSSQPSAEPMEVDALNWGANKGKADQQAGRGQGQSSGKKEARACHRCHRTGHLQRDCVAKTDKAGRKLNNDPKKGGSSKKLNCFECNKPGHKAAECPSKRRNRVNEVTEEPDDWADSLLTDGDLNEMVELQAPNFLCLAPSHRKN